jgi:hypothetical protein
LILFVLIVVFVLADLAVRRGWPPALRVIALWRRVQPSFLLFLRRSPATFAYLGVLSVTTWVLLGSSDKVTELILLEHSTSLHELRINPLKVLIRSAFWAPGYEFLPWVLLFALVLAPVEYWLGTRRWLLIFATGHVMATLASATALWFGIRYGWAASGLERTIDVGVSYGFAAVAAVFTFRLPIRWRWPWAIALLAAATVALWVDQSFTDLGHVLALGIGFSFYPLTRDIWAQSRLATPIWSTRSQTRLSGEGSFE